MTRMNFRNSQFIGSYTQLSQLPSLSKHEMALIGRSNVGKSSLINALVQKPIAKTSSTPGKTQTINQYLIDQTLTLFDLPGYGYAKMRQERLQWGDYIQEFFDKKGGSLSLFLLCLDLRHDLSTEDVGMIHFLKRFNTPLLVIFTKVDKLKEHEKKKNIEIISQQIKDTYSKPFEILPFSTKIPACCQKLEKMMELWVC